MAQDINFPHCYKQQYLLKCWTVNTEAVTVLTIFCVIQNDSSTMELQPQKNVSQNDVKRINIKMDRTKVLIYIDKNN